MTIDSETLPNEIDDLDEFAAEESKSKPELHHPELADQPLFSTLLQRTVSHIWKDDAVINDFVQLVAAPLSEHFAHITAKGGDFVQQQLQDGKSEKTVERYKRDQSMRAHLINGLFPVLHIAKHLQAWNAPQFRFYDETTQRLFIAGYLLHDYIKLPMVTQQLEAAGLGHDSLNPARHLSLVETILRNCCTQLKLDQFLQPIGGIESFLHDLIYVISNTQQRWGTMRNISALPRLHLHEKQRGLCEQLSRMADYIAYAAGTTSWEVASHSSLHRELTILSDQLAEFRYHHIAEVRGVITNLIQNAALDACRKDECVPILFAPSGVVYLVRRGYTNTPDVAAIANVVVEQVKRTSARQLRNNLTGFSRDGKGMKHADYYHLFFNRIELLSVGLDATFKIIREGKAPSAGKRFEKLRGWMETIIDPKTVDSLQVDQLAEWCFLAEKTIAGMPGSGDAAHVLLDYLGLGDKYAEFLTVPRDTRAGGVGYHWYWIAGYFYECNRHLDPQEWKERIRQLLQTLVDHLRSQPDKQTAGTTQPSLLTEESATENEQATFANLRSYVNRVLRIGSGVQNDTTGNFVTELARYSNAKKARGRTPLCSLCSSAYTVNKQQESAILFAPQVYSNKLVLHGSDAIRDICSICGTEIMLRQLLMNETSMKGKDFEGRNLRYLYLYPNYFFTPETMAILREVHDRLRNISFTDLRRQLVNENDSNEMIRFNDPGIWQRLEALLLTPTPPLPGQDRMLRLHFDQQQPISFFFLGIPPPGREAKDAESWVNPAFLALVLPLCLDVKVVVSQSPMPVINEANELAETVYFDGAHAAIGYIVDKERLNLDEVLPTLKRLTTTYLVHLDGNSDPGGKDFYRWQDLPTLARNLAESPLYAFHYLKKWQRKNGADSLPPAKAQLYLQYFTHLKKEDDPFMSHARTLTELYWRFYRAKRKNGKLNSNSILRPLSEAAKSLMAADRRIFPDREALTELMIAQVNAFVDRVDTRRADGYIPKTEVDGKFIIDQVAIDDFANYWVNKLFFDTLRGDLSALRGKQLNLLKNTCEAIYRDLDVKYWAEKGETTKEDEEVLVEQD